SPLRPRKDSKSPSSSRASGGTADAAPHAPRPDGRSVVYVLARHARMGRIARLVAGVRRGMGAVACRELEQEILLVDELVAGVVGNRVDARVHADGVAWACLDAVPAEDAAQLVDDELDRVALVAPPRVAFGVLACLDVDALGGARRGAAQAGHAARA